MKNLIRNIIFILLGFTFYYCAIQVAPSGGEIDKIPPEIVEYLPADKTINYPDNFFELTFSEYVDKRSVKEAIFISPAITGDIEYNWSGKTLEVSFERDSLRQNTTYVVTIGTDVKDLNNGNNMAQSFTFRFSTGNKIDNGIIGGKVYDKEPQGTFIFAYKLDTAKFNPSKVKPNYLSQVGENGNYKLMGLAESDYRILAVKDRFKNYLFDIDEDMYGFTFTDVKISEEDSVHTNIDFQLTKADTLVPHLMTATMTDRAHILLEFSEPVDSSKLKSGNFEIVDSTNNINHSVEYIYKGKSKAKEIFLAFKDSLKEENVYHLFVSNFEDRFGNANKKESISFAVNTSADTVPVKLSRFTTEFEKNQIDNLYPKVTFEYIDGFDNSKLDEAISIIDDKDNKLEFSVYPWDNAKFEIKLKEKIKAKSEIKVLIDMNKMPDALGNIEDSVYTYNFTAIDGLDFSGASGTVSDSSKNIILLLEEINKKESYTQKVIQNKFEFKRIKPGKYFLWGFNDKDSNNVLNKGDILNTELAERFFYYPDTLNLRARWPVGKINFELSN
ncbi:MAG: Ig-like domain-containing protein [Melioribacteraceae bacterium]|nr:Ig-like domain-containing protein [Melioribacteraceae bacterium]